MAEIIRDKTGRIIFTEQMKKEYTILCPNMLPIHFSLLVDTIKAFGYNCELLHNEGTNIAQEGLKYVHNDTCYPALLVIGQFIDALKSKKYDVNKVALLITQTGGGCRASNYIHLLRKALEKAKLEFVPVISLNLSGLEKNPGFKFTLPMIRRFIAALAYGDVLMSLHNQVKPYEIEKGESAKLVSIWQKRLSNAFKHDKGFNQKELSIFLKRLVSDFNAIPLERKKVKKVGVVGEIYVKYASVANNSLEDFLESQGCEINVPGLINFLLFKIDNRREDIDLYGGNIVKRKVVSILYDYFSKMQNIMINSIKENSSFHAPASYEQVKDKVKNIVGYGNKMGEGWLLTAEMITLVDEGFPNIVCTQPFGCLPNHIVGKGMIRKITEVRPKANIVAIDYDPSATKVNQENRIKLMLSMADE